MATTKAFELAQLSAEVESTTGLTTLATGIVSSEKIGAGIAVPLGNIHSKSTINNLLILESEDANADIIGVDSTGSTRLRSAAGAFSFWIGGDAGSTGVANGVDTLTIGNDGVITVSSTASSSSTSSGALVVAGGAGIAENLYVGGDTVITGDLTVEGTSVTLNTTDLNVEDKNITLNYHASNDTSASAGGSGITIQDAVDSTTDASILWDATNDKFEFSHETQVYGNLSVGIGNSKEAFIQATNSGRVASNPAYSFRSDVDTGMFNPNIDNTIAFATGGTERLRINGSGDTIFYEDNSGTPQVGMHWDYTDGRLGIGTTTPDSLLDVKIAEDTLANVLANEIYAATFLSTTSGNAGHTTAIMLSGSSGTNRGVAIAAEAQSTGNDHDMIFATSASGATPSEHVRITSDGKVGIGTNDPGESLVVAGDGARITVESATQEVAMLGRRGSSGVALESGYLRLRNQGVTADGIVLDSDNVSWLNGGNVGIGTDNPQALLELSKTTAGLISAGTGNQGATLRLHHEAQWEGGYGTAPTDPDFLGSIDFSTGDASTGEGVKASIRTSVESYYNTNHLNFYTADGSASTSMVERLSIQQNGRIVLNRGTTEYQPTVGVVKNQFTVHTDYNTTGTQHISLSNLDGNWFDGTSGADSQYGMLFGYNNQTRGGLIYDHRGSEMMTMWSSYAPIRFKVPDAADGDGVPIDTNIKTALAISLGGNIGIGIENPDTELHILDKADGGASWNTYQQVGRRAGTGDNLHFQTLHDGSDSINAMAVRIGSARQVEIDKRDSSYTMGVFNDGGQAGDGGALRVVASGRGVGIPDRNILQVENNNDVLFGVQNNGTLRGKNYLPTTRPAVLFDFANSKEVDNKITFERRSRATYHDADGMVRYAEVDEPRIEHNANTGECLGLLIEPSRTNFLPHISSSEWVWSASATIETFTDETLSPAGDYTAAKVCRGTDANYQTINYTTTSVPSGYVWVTFYGKEKAGAPQDGGRFFVQWLDSTYSWQNQSFFLNGESHPDDGPHFSSVDGTVQNTMFIRYVGNGWHHCGVRLQTGGQAISFSFHPFRADTVAGTGNTGASNETCQYLWGVQLESGDYPTSYIPTWASPAARASELAFVDVNEHKIYKEEDATMFVDAFVFKNGQSSGHPIVRFDDRDVLSNVGTQASGSMSILNLDLYSGGLAARIGNNGANGTNAEIGDFDANLSDFTKIALSYPNKTSVYYTHDGYQASNTDDSSTTIPETTDISRLWFGNTQETTCIRKFAYWNKYYDLNTLNALTEE